MSFLVSKHYYSMELQSYEMCMECENPETHLTTHKDV